MKQTSKLQLYSCRPAMPKTNIFLRHRSIHIKTKNFPKTAPGLSVLAPFECVSLLSFSISRQTPLLRALPQLWCGINFSYSPFLHYPFGFSIWPHTLQFSIVWALLQCHLCVLKAIDTLRILAHISLLWFPRTHTSILASISYLCFLHIHHIHSVFTIFISLFFSFSYFCFCLLHVIE